MKIENNNVENSTEKTVSTTENTVDNNKTSQTTIIANNEQLLQQEIQFLKNKIEQMEIEQKNSFNEDKKQPEKKSTFKLG